MGYPSLTDEASMLEGQRLAHPLEALKEAVTLNDIVVANQSVREVRLEKPVRDYILQLVQATREDPRLRLGSSPRGSLALYRIVQSLAFCSARDYVLPDDVQEMAVQVLAHRLVLDTKSKYAGVSKEQIVREILGKTKVPT